MEMIRILISKVIQQSGNYFRVLSQDLVPTKDLTLHNPYSKSRQSEMMLWSPRLKIVKAPGKDFSENLKGQTEII